MILSFKQKKVLEAASHRESALVCGFAGAGKTTMAHALKRFLKATIVSCCPTMAARAGWDTLDEWLLRPTNPLLRTKVLAIDDAHLMTNDALVELDRRCRKDLETPDALFGGLTVVVLVDFFQSHSFCKNEFNRSFPVVVHLTEPYNIEPVLKEAFVDICFRNRTEHVALTLAQQTVDQDKASALYLDATADIVNMTKLNALPSIATKRVYTATTRTTSSSATDEAVHFIDSSLPFQTVVTLCIGARVILIADYDTKQGLLTGLKGTVRGYDPEMMPIIQFDNGVMTAVDNTMWNVPRYPSVQRLQIPLKLSWAVRTTDLPSFSIDHVVIDTTKIPATKLYHALSKCKRFETIKLV